MMEYSVERLTELYAVCAVKSGAQILVPRALIDGEVHEGAILRERGGRYAADPAREQALRAELHSLAESLFD